MTDLPVPSSSLRQRSAELSQRIRAEIEANGGWIGFDRYMQRALYEPGLGYYSGGGEKFGPRGDFLTAPELGDVLAQAVVAQFADLLNRFDEPIVFELGAGSGKLAADCLDALDARGMTEVRYLILEPSASLKARQQRRLERFGTRVEWLSALPSKPFDGLVLANEVVDALPAQRFLVHGSGVRPLGVAVESDGFIWAEGDPDPGLTQALEALQTELESPLPDSYRSELRLVLGAWIASITASLRRGALLCIDYGLVRREYYHAERSDGTLVCHYRHRTHADPFYLPGLQDISAWVDFSALADACREAGLELAGFTTQGMFLVEVCARLPGDTLRLADPRVASALRTLVLPGEMGERFKLLLATRGCETLELAGRDFRNRL